METNNTANTARTVTCLIERQEQSSVINGDGTQTTNEFALKCSIGSKQAPVRSFPSIGQAFQAAEFWASQYGKKIDWQMGTDAMSTWAAKRVGTFTV